MNRSYSLTVPPIADCFEVAGDFIKARHGVRPVWKSRTEQQRRLLYACEALGCLSRFPEIESVVDVNVEVINNFLKQRGFDIELDPSGNPLAFHVASVLDLLLKWSRPGTETEVLREFKKYRAARVTDHFATYRGETGPACRLTCENGDLVFLAPTFQRTALPLDLRNFVMGLERSLVQNSNYKAVVFPNVKFEEYPDLDWITGRYDGIHETDTGPHATYYVEQAKQQTRFAMDHEGAHLESAAAMTFAGSGYMPPSEIKPDFVIDQPFMLWIRRSGVDDPIFFAHFFEDAWIES